MADQWLSMNVNPYNTRYSIGGVFSGGPGGTLIGGPYATQDDLTLLRQQLPLLSQIYPSLTQLRTINPPPLTAIVLGYATPGDGYYAGWRWNVGARPAQAVGTIEYHANRTDGWFSYVSLGVLGGPAAPPPVNVAFINMPASGVISGVYYSPFVPGATVTNYSGATPPQIGFEVLGPGAVHLWTNPSQAGGSSAYVTAFDPLGAPFNFTSSNLADGAYTFKAGLIDAAGAFVGSPVPITIAVTIANGAVIVNTTGLTVRPIVAKMLAAPVGQRYDSYNAVADDTRLINYAGIVSVQWFVNANIGNVVAQRRAQGKLTGMYRDPFRVNPGDSSLWNQTFTAPDGSRWTVNGSSPWFSNYDATFAAWVVGSGMHPGSQAVMLFMISQAANPDVDWVYLDDISTYGSPNTIETIIDHFRAIRFFRTNWDTAKISRGKPIGGLAGNIDGLSLAFCWWKTDVTNANIASGAWALPASYAAGQIRAVPRGGTDYNMMEDIDWICLEGQIDGGGGGPYNAARTILETGWADGIQRDTNITAFRRWDSLTYCNSLANAIIAYNANKARKPKQNGALLNGDGTGSAFTYYPNFSAWGP